MALRHFYQNPIVNATVTQVKFRFEQLVTEKGRRKTITFKIRILFAYTLRNQNPDMVEIAHRNYESNIMKIRPAKYLKQTPHSEVSVIRLKSIIDGIHCGIEDQTNYVEAADVCTHHSPVECK